MLQNVYKHWFWFTTLRAVCIWTKSCDHENRSAFENHPKAILWRSTSTFAIDGPSSLVGSWSGLREGRRHILWMSKIVGSPGPNHGNIILLKSMAVWLLVMALGFAFKKYFEESNAVYGSPWNIIHLLPRRTPCQFLIHSNFFGPSDPQGLMYGELGPFSASRSIA